MRAALLCFPTPCVRQPSPNFNPLPVPPLCRPPHLASAASPKTARLSLLPRRRRRRRGRPPGLVASAGTEEAELQPPAGQQQGDATPEDLENVRQIQRVLELLKKNRDMLFGEVKLTIMIEDPRDIERKRLLGIEDPDEVTRDDLAVALEDVNEGRIPENRNALRLLAKEMTEWPDLEVEAPKKKSRPNKSLYAKATDTGVDPKTAAKRLNVDWDSAADIESDDEAADIEVPPAVGYGALYLVTALPLVIGISVVLILFYNSLQ
ncbi:protein CHLOROPLAST ENHANCING STRESS TOLERANCE, chloroplastic [Ananas comosus]|uniref:Protein CHLOROPLAST ENHANCING STRESS TOLERANCE, chloroplastic n=1 Tax=Ananas comosus TaxID=4615 RepID=A0A6P5F0X5_ANACO|nr:protein CHLOROPLAST ENHANCING STRESS TOLERANCE, chloroplastic [Ananas comosus]